MSIVRFPGTSADLATIASYLTSGLALTLGQIEPVAAAMHEAVARGPRCE